MFDVTEIQTLNKKTLAQTRSDRFVPSESLNVTKNPFDQIENCSIFPSDHFDFSNRAKSVSSLALLMSQVQQAFGKTIRAYIPENIVVQRFNGVVGQVQNSEIGIAVENRHTAQLIAGQDQSHQASSQWQQSNLVQTPAQVMAQLVLGHGKVCDVRQLI
ncbi:hypothetical protein BpHYR1_038438 [Brachionus plicatilis]|uniref:Uncharacterized protein n=1 Tax=Brachionus plicatilis TaxID=10195 RepID=A0A3M7S0B9_BRAPC|nr:hypothetical protein BpHYR1_038438 [Brachionus plicatilis]